MHYVLDVAAKTLVTEPGERLVLVMFCASGGGIALAASLWRWP